ncbi:MAG: HU family DNA-binding protein [Bacteroidaceae bacterium]|nr:HU family DNA-binding protein [Bacteroidaceae bacterium]
MAFYKVRLQKKSGLYYPQAVVVGKQVSTKQLGKALSDRSTVTLADTLAVLSELGTVMSTFMAQGRSVSLEGLGSFRYTINSQKQGVETAEEVNSDQIKSVRVRFVPEVTRNADKSVATRSMQPAAVEWVEWAGKADDASTGGDSGSAGFGGGNDDGSSPL